MKKTKTTTLTLFVETSNGSLTGTVKAVARCDACGFGPFDPSYQYCPACGLKIDNTPPVVEITGGYPMEKS